jgi:hypothetical protein
MASESTHEKNSWETLSNLKSTLVNQSKQAGNIIKNSASAVDNKWKESSTVTKVIIVGSGAAVVAPLAIIPVLGVAGFTSAGVAAGSIAASMQTATTLSGSLFALCQSAGAVGAVAASTSVGVGLAAGATAGGVTAAICRKKPPSQNNGETEQTEIEEQAEVEEQAEIEEQAEVEEQAEIEEQVEIEEHVGIVRWKKRRMSKKVAINSDSIETV